MNVVILKQREEELEGYYYALINGRKYSVVDFGTTMRDHPYPDMVYRGWEAVPFSRRGNLKIDDLVRAETWGELESIITRNHDVRGKDPLPE